MFISLYGAPLRWLPVRPPSLDVRECQPGVSTGESRMFQALVVPDRYPLSSGPFCLPLAVRQCVRVTLSQLFGYVSEIWLSHARCACMVGNLFQYGIRVLRCDYSRVTRVSSASYDSSNVPAVFAHFWLRRGRMVLRLQLYCLTSRFTPVWSL